MQSQERLVSFAKALGRIMGTKTDVRQETSESARATLLDDKALAQILHVSSITVRRMWQRGELPAPLKIGRQNRWRRKDIYKWIAELHQNQLYNN